MKRKLLAMFMVSMLALCTVACSAPSTQNAPGSDDASKELIEAIEELPVDPVDAVSSPDSGARPEDTPAGGITGNPEAPLPEDIPADTSDSAAERSTQETPAAVEPSTGAEKESPGIVLSEKEIMGEAMDGGFYITDIRTDKVNIIIPDMVGNVPVVSIAGYALSGTDIESVVFPDTLEMIGEAEFEGCESLRHVYFGKGLKYIGTMPFSGCGKLETVAFPEGMQFFDDVTFHSCVNLKEVYVPTSATEFGSGTPIVDIKTCPNAVVITPAGSPAQKICEERGVPVKVE